MFFVIFMIVALSTQLYGSDNNDNSDESDFQRIQWYREITPERPNFFLRARTNPTKYSNHDSFKLDYEFRYIALKEFVELGNQSWNNNDLARKNVYTAVAYQYIAPDYLALKISTLIKYDAQNIMNKSQHCLENITELLDEKEIKKMLQNMVAIENEIIQMLTES